MLQLPYCELQTVLLRECCFGCWAAVYVGQLCFLGRPFAMIGAGFAWLLLVAVFWAFAMFVKLRNGKAP